MRHWGEKEGEKACSPAIPDAAQLVREPISRLSSSGLTIREALRRKGSPYDELGLDDPKWTVDDLIDLMLKHPILINRTFVVTEKGARLARPKETALEIL